MTHQKSASESDITLLRAGNSDGGAGGDTDIELGRGMLEADGRGGRRVPEYSRTPSRTQKRFRCRDG
ncbi:hypothetical protein BGW80DRAFT_1307876 [Lactifluus volemus]|nr:hypothetical protein BGW80DRAFT_1355914 [Lactifluus volemus]KAH9973524.1 hypothetical protein BGW80DRAFT_1307876 [Lactifluus volemus]